jgi:Protein of unknown function (DUF742)
MSTGWEHGHGGARRRVRSYVVAGGRTESDRMHLELEALVVTTPAGERALPVLQLEHAAIVTSCRLPVSVAEVSALLDVPLGVARVLIGDMAAEGLVAVHQPTNPGSRPDITLLERVLQRLRAL